jgi:hypothetical protein
VLGVAWLMAPPPDSWIVRDALEALGLSAHAARAGFEREAWKELRGGIGSAVRESNGWNIPGYNDRKRVAAFVAWVLLMVLRGKELP